MVVVLQRVCVNKECVSVGGIVPKRMVNNVGGSAASTRTMPGKRTEFDKQIERNRRPTYRACIELFACGWENVRRFLRLGECLGRRI